LWGDFCGTCLAHYALHGDPIISHIRQHGFRTLTGKTEFWSPSKQPEAPLLTERLTCSSIQEMESQWDDWYIYPVGYKTIAMFHYSGFTSL
jgi:hypothetical protein